MYCTNSELIQALKDLIPLSIWLKVRFLTHVYGKNPIGRGQPTLCAPQVPRLRIITTKQRWKLRINVMATKKIYM